MDERHEAPNPDAPAGNRAVSRPALPGGQHALPVYTPSGKFGWRAPARVLLVGVPVAAILACLYALWLHYSPGAWISLPGLALFSVLIGIAASMSLKQGHSRSRRFSAAVGAFLGGVALWVHWAVWIFIGFDQGPKLAGHFITSGPTVWIGMLGLLAERLVELDPERFMVTWLPWLWIAEAAIFVWLPSALARTQAEEPYSEPGGAWADDDLTGELWWDGGLSSEVRRRLEEEGVDFLLRMPRAATVGLPAASQWWTLSVACKQVAADPLARWLSLTIVEQRREPNGKIKSERIPILNDWVVDPSNYARLAAHLTPPPAAPDGPSGDTPGELRPALAAMEAHDFSRAITLAEGFRGHDDPRLRADALRLCALCHARLERWEMAFDNYHALFACEPSVMNALQLATTSVMAGQMDRAGVWFDEAGKMNAETNAMPWPELQMQYLSALENKAEWATGLPQVTWLRDMYQSMASSDDQFAFSHHMPFLGVFFEKALPFLCATLSEPEIIAWYAVMRERLDASGQAQLESWLAQLPGACARRHHSTRMARKSLTLVSVGPVTNRSPSAEK